MLVFERQTTSACRCRRPKAEDGAEDCHSQYDILHPVWPVASDSYRGVPHPCCRNEGHQLRPPSPTREGTCSHNHPWGVEQCGFTLAFLTKSLLGPRFPARSPEVKPSRRMSS